MNYQIIIDYILERGNRLPGLCGNIKDIGIVKTHLTQEDIDIENGFETLIKSFGPNHKLYAEEEHDSFKESDDVWVVDPISGTANLIMGSPHYSVVVSHVHKNVPVFAAVYDPSVKELYTAYKDGGAFLNGKKIQVSKNNPKDKHKILFNYSMGWREEPKARYLWNNLFDFRTYRNSNSFAVNYCYIAAGRFDGIVTLSKDTFPEYAGSLIIQEAGGILTNYLGKPVENHKDRIFVGGNKPTHDTLQPLLAKIFS